ncbi:hypothetical protein [Prosthecobacter sp.]|uniref:hypothetical protein n=1 Tax=Prosthecobacter sp. TaxID=1965333 RepID=UPI0037837146
MNSIFKQCVLLGACLLLPMTAQAQGIRKANSTGGCGAKNCPLPPLGSQWPNATDFTEYSLDPPEVGSIRYFAGGCRPKGGDETASYGTEIMKVTAVNYNATFNDWEVSIHDEVYNLPGGMSVDPNQWPDCNCVRKLTGGINFQTPYFTPAQLSGSAGSSLPAGCTEVQMPATSNGNANGLPVAGCSTCGSGGDDDDEPGKVRISIGMGGDTVAGGALAVNGMLNFSVNLTEVHTLSLSSLAFSNVLGGDVSTLTAGTR